MSLTVAMFSLKLIPIGLLYAKFSIKYGTLI